MHYFLTTLFLFFTTLLLHAQNHPTCDGSRYVSEVFTSVDTTEGVFYGSNLTYNGNNKDLYMDIYEPTGDLAVTRPAIVLAFGGSFINGNREDLDALCRYYAKRGYVAVTIDYRLYDGGFFPLPDSVAMTDVVIKAVGDMKAAVRFLRQDAATTNNYQIDTNYIFVGGVSAGGIVANHVAYLGADDTLMANEQTAINNNGGFEGNTTNNANLYSSSVQGVVNFSGALRSAEYIDANDPPLFSAHDDGDGVVPYGNGFATIAGFPIVYIEGSQTMAAKATNIGLPNILITLPNSSGHVSYFQSNAAQWADTVRSTASQFLHDEVICPIVISLNKTGSQNLLANFYPNPSPQDVMIAFEELPSAYNLVLYDNMGRVVRTVNNIQNDRYVLSREKLPAGMYHAQLQFEAANRAPVQASIIFQ
ncbi:MAG: alpha/beta hydrolase fold domain-containing protein [Aureispira sp.]